MKNKREIVFMKYDGKCAYCGVELQKGWHIDHIEPIVRYLKGSDCKNPHLKEDINNLNPACPSCNIQKNSFTLEQFRDNIRQFTLSLNQYSTQYKFAKKFGLVKETKIEVVFYFEKK